MGKVGEVGGEQKSMPLKMAEGHWMWEGRFTRHAGLRPVVHTGVWTAMKGSERRMQLWHLPTKHGNF